MTENVLLPLPQIFIEVHIRELATGFAQANGKLERRFWVILAEPFTPADLPRVLMTNVVGIVIGDEIKFFAATAADLALVEAWEKRHANTPRDAFRGWGSE